jgi:gliding motility-associated-like protein
MKVNYFRRGGITSAFQEISLFIKQRKIHKIYGISAFIASILFPVQILFAQDPTLTGIEASALNYDEGQSPTPITSSSIVSDADSPMLTSATIQITTNYLSSEDLLNFTNAFSISGSYDPLTGTMTLTGPASPADFTSAILSITYQNINNDNPSNLVRTLSLSVNDGSSNSLTVNRNIQVNGINDAPVGLPDSFVMDEDTELDCGCLLINDGDPDGDDLTAVVGRQPYNGTITDLGGFFIYTPNPNFFGTDTFTYYANDGTQNSNETLVTVVVRPINDAPIALNDGISTDEDTAINIPLLSNDIDVDDVLDASMIVLVTSPNQGTLTINTTTGIIAYTPNLNFNGNDTFTYQVKDASGALSNIATVNIVVHPVNDAPIASPDFAVTQEEIAISIPVLANDSDVDNTLDGTSLIVAAGASNGSAVVQPDTGLILYTPNKDFSGTDSFTYTLKDAGGATSLPATVTITVSPVNDPPVAVNDQATTEENTPVNINILQNDFDVDNDIIATSVIITSNPAHGTVIFNPSTGLANFTPATDFVGNDSFTYTVQDPGGLTSLAATVSVTVTAAPNRAPDAVDDGPIKNSSLTPITIDVLANDHDPDNDQNELSIVSVANPSSGTVTIVNGKVVYQSAGLISGTVTFSYTIQDPSGLTDEAIVTIENFYPPLRVSEGFSPNNDANNDTWYMPGIEYYPNNSVKVFDRWGFLVYYKQGYENINLPWDGRGNTTQQSGKLLDQGAYYYILEPGDGMKTMTGNVVIVR